MTICINKMMTGEKLKSYRLDKSLSINEVAMMTGISKKSISNIENGVNLISTQNLVILCSYYKVSIDSTIVYDITQ